MILPGMRIRR
eukprot:gene22146-28676_t